jgi:hypothetical protein
MGGCFGNAAYGGKVMVRPPEITHLNSRDSEPSARISSIIHNINILMFYINKIM